MTSELERERELNQKGLTEVEPIRENRNQYITSREQIKQLVEPPLVEACETFYDLNIRTLSSSANTQDIELGFANIIVALDSMSKDNAELAKKLGEEIEYDGKIAIQFKFPVTTASTTAEIQENSLSLAKKFSKQKLTWAPSFTIEELKQWYAIEEGATYADDPNAWVEEVGYYYDPASAKFFLSEELFRKQLEI